MHQRLLPLLCAGLLAIAMPAQAAEKPVSELLSEASKGLAQFTFDWPRALFREALERAEPGSEDWAHASFGLASCLLYGSAVNEGAVNEARNLYEGIVDKAGATRFAPNACLILGRIAEVEDFYRDVSDLPAARIRYREVVTRWPELPIAGEATLRLAGTYVSTNTPEDAHQAITLLQEWLTTHPQDPLASAMWLLIGQTTFLCLNDHVGALPFLVKADVIGLPSAAKSWMVFWRIAVTAEHEAKDRALAIRYYTRICTDNQTSGKAFEAQMALARLGAPVPELNAFSTYSGSRPALPAPAQEGAP